MLVNTATYGIDRDGPVDHVRTIYNTETPKSVHYACVCGAILWTHDDQALENFLTTHQQCGE